MDDYCDCATRCTRCGKKFAPQRRPLLPPPPPRDDPPQTWRDLFGRKWLP